MTTVPYLDGKVFINYRQIAELLKLYCDFETKYDPNRRIKVLYHNDEYPEGIPLHEAFAYFASKMIDAKAPEVTL